MRASIFSIFAISLLWTAAYATEEGGAFVPGGDGGDLPVSSSNESSVFVGGQERDFDQFGEKMDVDQHPDQMISPHVAFPSEEEKAVIWNEAEQAQGEGSIFEQESGFATKPADASSLLEPRGHSIYSEEDAKSDPFEWRDIAKVGRNNFSMVLMKDGYDYTSRNDIFNRTFRGADSEFPLALYLNGHRMAKYDWANMGAGLGLGIGYNSGKTIFADGTKGGQSMLLWTAPVDLSLMAELAKLRAVLISVYGGPSLLVLHQNRGDSEYGESNKLMTQVGKGYFAAAAMKIALNWGKGEHTASMIQHYSIFAGHLMILGRYQYYTQFKSSDIQVSGLSLGVGVSFDYF